MSLMDTIERIPVQLKKILANKDLNQSKVQAVLKMDTQIRKIVIIASGTSYNAAFTTKNFAEAILSVPVEIIYPNIFVHYYNQDLLKDDYLYVFISQGGKTKLVYEALQLVKAKGLITLSLTESLDTPIAELADISLEIGSENEEYVYRTLGYSATCSTLYWLYISMAGMTQNVSSEEIQTYIKDFQSMIQNLPAITDNTVKWYNNNKSQLMQKTAFLFSGTNDLWPVAQEADIKFMEMVPILTNSFELEELIHGPQNAFNSSIGYFILSRADEDDKKAASIANFIKQEVSPCYVIGDNEEADFNINPKSIHFSSLEYITFFQVLAFLLATDNQRDLTKGIYPQVVNYITKSL